MATAWTVPFCWRLRRARAGSHPRPPLFWSAQRGGDPHPAAGRGLLAVSPRLAQPLAPPVKFHEARCRLGTKALLLTRRASGAIALTWPGAKAPAYDWVKRRLRTAWD